MAPTTLNYIQHCVALNKGCTLFLYTNHTPSHQLMVSKKSLSKWIKMQLVLVDNWKINVISLIWNNLGLPDIQLVYKALIFTSVCVC